MKLLFVGTFSLFTLFTYSQQNKWALTDSSARFTEYVTLAKTSTNYNLYGSISSWLIQNEKALQLQLINSKTNEQQILVEGFINIEDDKHLFTNINCQFKLQILISQNGYAIEWQNMRFEKNGKYYAVADIYNSIQQQQPIEKLIYESKRNALARHTYILNCLQKKLTQITKQLKYQVQQQMELEANLVIN
jgi:hypothetical protein